MNGLQLKELQPIDRYCIRLSRPLTVEDQQLIYSLYQPLVGTEAVSLYMTLWTSVERDPAREYTHYYLMNLFNTALMPIFQARITLEAIGLMTTYRKVLPSGEATFTYYLHSPVDAKTFFEDPLLSTFLLSRVGEKMYLNLRERFVHKVPDFDSYEDVSRTFVDVFRPSTQQHTKPLNNDEYLESRDGAKGIQLYLENFDFELLEMMLSEQLIPSSIFDEISRVTIAKLAFFYDFGPMEMKEIILIAMNYSNNGMLTERDLRRATVDYYKLNVSNQIPILERTFKKEVSEQENNDEELSKEDKLIYYLEQTSPKEMLADILGAEPFPVDVELADRLMNVHKLPHDVVNVLLQYVLLRNNGKITNGFAERIASHWAHKKIKNAREAINISRREHDQYMKWLKESKEKKMNGHRPVTRVEKVPEWMKEKEKQQKNQQVKKETMKQPADPLIEQKRLQLIKELGIQES